MPNWKYPCIKVNCQKPVKSNQKGLQCNICEKWIHLKCTDLTVTQYELLKDNADLPFYCLNCKPRSIYADVIFDNTTLCINNDSTNSLSNSSACSSDFEWVDDSDPESSM